MGRWLTSWKTGAEWVAAVLFAAMFGAFLLQILFRYVLNSPLPWTLEVCLITYVWVVFWAAAFLVDERDHVAFTYVYDAVAPPVRRVLAILGALILLAAFVVALPATADFVTFMAIDKTWVLGLRFDLVFSIFLVFMIGVIARTALRLARLSGGGWRDHL